MIKISGFIDEASGKLDEQIVILKELRQEYMCPRTIDGKNITGISYKDFMKDIKPRLDANKIKFSSIGSGIGKIKLYDDEAYKGQLKNLEQLIKIAQAMECKYIRIFSFFVDEKGDYDSYIDEDDISSFAVDAVDFVSRTGIMIGDDDGAFRPTEDLVRIEAAVALNRIFKIVNVF